MEEKLIIPKRDPDEEKSSSCVVRVSKKALTLINSLCADTNRTQMDIASRLIEWAYDRAEVVEDGETDEQR